MTILKLNARGRDLELAEAPDRSIEAAISDALADLAPDAPIIVMTHGLRFSPFHPGFNPHRHILSLTPDTPTPRIKSWPRHLGFGRGRAGEGLAIALGWEGRGNFWAARDRAALAGAALARLTRIIADDHGRTSDIVAHSLGARVALTATSAARPGAIGRVILMAAAAFRGEAETALHAPGGASAEFINITSHENDLFDLLIEALIRRRSGPALGAGLHGAHANWLDVAIDDPDTLDGLSALGFRVAPASRTICHWSTYLRPGLFRFYNTLLNDRSRLPMGLIAELIPQTPKPRLSRLSLPRLIAVPGRTRA